MHCIFRAWILIRMDCFSGVIWTCFNFNSAIQRFQIYNRRASTIFPTRIQQIQRTRDFLAFIRLIALGHNVLHIEKVYNISVLSPQKEKFLLQIHCNYNSNFIFLLKYCKNESLSASRVHCFKWILEKVINEIVDSE